VHPDSFDQVWIRKYFEPYYTVLKQTSKDVGWQVDLVVSQRGHQEMDLFVNNRLREQERQEGDSLIIYYQDNNCVLVTQKMGESKDSRFAYVYVDMIDKTATLLVKEYTREVDYALVRIVRTIMNQISLLSGDLHLHASGVAFKDRAIIFIGDKQQGKTTAMLNTCFYGKADYISNDHLIVKTNDNNQISVMGVPTSVGIRLKALRYYSVFSDYVKQIKKPDYLFQANFNVKDKKRYFLVSELVNKLGVKISARAEPGVVIMPVHDRQVSYVDVQEVDINTISAGIEELIIDDPCEQVPFWRQLNRSKLFKQQNNYKKKVRELIEKTNIYRIRYNESLFKDFAMEVGRLTGGRSENYLYNKALQFAHVHYSSQERKDGKSMISHVWDVAGILQDQGFSDVNLLTVAILHDILEESYVTKEKLFDNFGAKISQEVETLTIIKQANEKFESEMKRMKYKLHGASRIALLVKVSDRLHNLQNMDDHPEYFRADKITRYKKATKEILDEVIVPQIGEVKLVTRVRAHLNRKSQKEVSDDKLGKD
jgi:hypothetical protein